MKLHQVTDAIQIGFDDSEGKLVIYNFHRPIPGFIGNWQHIATFTTAKDWDESPYAKMVCDDHMENMITWFWIDHDTSIISNQE